MGESSKSSFDQTSDQTLRSPPFIAKKRTRSGHNLSDRMRERMASVLLFIRDPNVPPTNNLSEQDIRPLKLKQKISGGFQTVQESQDFVILRSIFETARKQGWGILSTLQADLNELIQKLRNNGTEPEI